MEALLDLVAGGRIDVKSLITHRFSIDEAPRAYQLISGGLKENYLAVVLNYDTEREVGRRIENQTVAWKATKASKATAATKAAGRVGVGLIGAGGYAQKVLLPNFKAAGAEFCSIASASGCRPATWGRSMASRGFCQTRRV